MDDGTRASFESGDIILTKAFSINEFKDTICTDLNSYWAIVTKETILFKQITNFNEAEGVSCQALNQRAYHPDIIIGLEDIQDIYRVMQKQAKPVNYGDWHTIIKGSLRTTLMATFIIHFLNEMIMDEIWKDIEGYEGLYQVWNLGRVQSLPHYEYSDRFTKGRFRKGRLLKPFKVGANYLAVGLGRGKKAYIHRLVAVAFIPNPLNKEEIDHVNCDITDNTVANLKWVTRKENLNNPITKRRNSASRKGCYQPKGKDNSRSRAILQFSLNGEFIREWAN